MTLQSGIEGLGQSSRELVKVLPFILQSIFIIKAVPSHTLKILGGTRKAEQIYDIDFLLYIDQSSNLKWKIIVPGGEETYQWEELIPKAPELGFLLFTGEFVCDQSCNHYFWSMFLPALSFLSFELYNIFKDSFVGKWGAAFSNSLLKHFYFHFQSYVAFSKTKKALGEQIAAQVKASTKN